VLGWRGWEGWFMWVVLLMLIGVDHPPTADALTPLDPRRRVAAWLTVVLFVLTFIPEPLAVVRPSPVFEGERTLVRAAPPPGEGWGDQRLSSITRSPVDGLEVSGPTATNSDRARLVLSSSKHERGALRQCRQGVEL